uniref:Uncharacterized protein n=1 Tax=Arundo donax TaxID=35708 RepID=A0A0A9B3Z1_ARUDO
MRSPMMFTQGTATISWSTRRSTWWMHWREPQLISRPSTGVTWRLSSRMW